MNNIEQLEAKLNQLKFEKELEERVKKNRIDICYHIPFDRYFYQTKGYWQLNSPVKKAAVSAYLTEVGYTLEEAKTIISNTYMPKVFGVTFAQTPDMFVLEDERLYINAYKPSKLQPVEGQYPNIVKLLKVLTDDDIGAIKYIKNWLAYKVQNPLSKPLTALVFQGVPGTGKNTFENIIREVFGPDNVKNLGPMDITSAFNSHYINGLFAMCDEALVSEGLFDNSQKLKQLITDSNIMCSTKGLPLYELPNKLALIFSSNKSRPVHVEPGDRRFSVFKSANIEFGNPHTQMLRGLYSLTGNGFTPEFMEEIAAFYYDLIHHSVDINAVRSPYENRARHELINVSKSGFEVWWDEIKEFGVDEMVEDYKEYMLGVPDGLNDKHWNDGTYYSAELIHKMFSWWCKNGSGYRDIGRNKFYADIVSLGVEKVQKRVPGTESKIYCFKGLPKVTTVKPKHTKTYGLDEAQQKLKEYEAAAASGFSFDDEVN